MELFTMLLCSAVGAAAPLAEAPPLAELERQVLETAPTLEVLAARRAAAAALIDASGRLPDPMLEWMVQEVDPPAWTVGREEMSMVGAEWRQGLPGRSRRAADSRMARAAFDSVDAALHAARADALAAVREAYAALWYADREAELNEAGAELLALLRETATIRYATGDGDQATVLALQVEEQTLAQRREELAAERAGAGARLNNWLGRPVATPSGSVRELPATAWPASGEVSVRAPRLVAAQAAEETARARVAVAEGALRPEYSIGAGLYDRGGFDSLVTLRVGISLPLQRELRQVRALRAARHEAQAAAREHQFAVEETRAQLWALRAQYEAAASALVRDHEAILPLTAAAFEAARAAFLGGRGGIEALLGRWQAWLQARRAAAQHEATAFLLWTSGQRLLGEVAP